MNYQNLILDFLFSLFMIKGPVILTLGTFRVFMGHNVLFSYENLIQSIFFLFFKSSKIGKNNFFQNVSMFHEFHMSNFRNIFTHVSIDFFLFISFHLKVYNLQWTSKGEPVLSLFITALWNWTKSSSSGVPWSGHDV